MAGNGDACASVRRWKSIPPSIFLARLLAVYDTEIKDEVFIEKLGSVSIKEIIRTAKERKGGAMGYSEAILINYNGKGHGALSIQKLYSRVPPKAPSLPEDSLREAAAQIQNSQIEEVRDQTAENELHLNQSPTADSQLTDPAAQIAV